MDWNLTDIRAKVRKLTGRPTIGQLSVADLDNEINYFYQDVLPYEIDLHEFDAQISVSLTDGTGTASLDATTLSVAPPVTIEDSDGVVTPVNFYTKYFGKLDGLCRCR